ncbi:MULTISPECIES: hypothetical protein [Mycobacterium]|uniref:Uncharacterized protein n=1 Tax=Mycobacterium paraffinicum TaxID=53378 RepID=A0A1Q4HP35_9MYCO|nr:MULTISPECIES: hypothetical protein [Mycobacterium]OCB23521.1 hypothetical protein A5689_15495 [Mycobacterium intracellulare subsp. yongonense]OJZ69417.1 hypothetical protein BRW65_22665 [Mycobacterium paraffinicum]
MATADLDDSMTFDDIALVDSSRARRLLQSALRHGLEVYPTASTQRCWTIRKPNQRYGGESLTVYGEANNSAHVLYDPSTGSTWEEITQVRAFTIIQAMSGLQ